MTDTDAQEVVEKAIGKLFWHWKLNEEEARILLGDKVETVERQRQLLTIHRSLRLLYPKNPELLYGWIKMRNRDFDNKRPIDLLTSEQNGFSDVVKYLNHKLFS
ncbi:hypothetical protein CTH30272_03056 [Allocatenococcus thiocycli]|nr:hypothetical protein CTH30272_03056 [Catenococcus thiocycli]